MIAPKIIGAGVVGLAMWLGYQTYSDRLPKARRIRAWQRIETQLQSMREADAGKIAELSTLLDAVQNRVVSRRQIWRTRKKPLLQPARKSLARMRLLRQALDEQAKNVNTIREQSDASPGRPAGNLYTQFGEVNGQVSTVKTDLESTKGDLAANRREVGDMRDSLGRQIARNADELAALKRSGERDYFEFDIRKTKEMERVAGIRVQLNKADVKAKKYDITLQVDDSEAPEEGAAPERADPDQCREGAGSL